MVKKYRVSLTGEEQEELKAIGVQRASGGLQADSRPDSAAQRRECGVQACEHESRNASGFYCAYFLATCITKSGS